MRINVTLEGGDAPRTFNLNGRLGWLMFQLAKPGSTGYSTIENPAARISAYIHELRGLGITIDTEMVPHGGDYPGRHARYRLACDAVVKVLA